MITNRAYRMSYSVLTKDTLDEIVNAIAVNSMDWYVSYTRACETSAGCLRSIYPSLGMRQLFGDVTMG